MGELVNLHDDQWAEYRRGYERYVDKYEVAKLLGKSVSWVEKKSADLMFPSHKIGGHRKYRLSEIEAWVHEQEAA